jgi:hypothetical protein
VVVSFSICAFWVFFFLYNPPIFLLYPTDVNYISPLAEFQQALIVYSTSILNYTFDCCCLPSCRSSSSSSHQRALHVLYTPGLRHSLSIFLFFFVDEFFIPAGSFSTLFFLPNFIS